MSERDARIEADRLCGRECRNGRRNVDIDVDSVEVAEDAPFSSWIRGGMMAGGVYDALGRARRLFGVQLVEVEVEAKPASFRRLFWGTHALLHPTSLAVSSSFGLLLAYQRGVL